MADLTAIYCELYMMCTLNALLVNSTDKYTTVQLYILCADMHAIHISLHLLLLSVIALLWLS